jgi:hypothetical protein
LAYFKHFKEALVKNGTMAQAHPNVTETMIEHAHTRVSMASTS